MKKPRLPWWPEETQAWEAPENLTVSQCADKYRVLTGKSEKRGQWETDHNPVMRSYQDAFGVDCVQEIWLVKPAQAGGTDGILNMLLFAALQDPGPALVVEPNELLADKVSTDRIDDMIESCDKLKAILKPGREETGKKKKTFSSMTIYFGWAGSAVSLASQPCRIVVLDEVDKYDEWTGGEASPIELAKERTSTFRYTKKQVFTSTPTIEEGYVTKGEKACDARFRYHVDCPYCGAEQQLKREGLRWPDGADPREVERVAWYECEHCQKEIHEDRRLEIVRRGRWRDTVSGLTFDECIEKIKPRSVGFQFNRLYTPWFSFGMVAAEYLITKDTPRLYQNFINSWMAEPYAEKVEAKTENELLSRRVTTPALICPDNTVALTAGMDMGQGGFWFLVLAWLNGMVKQVVDYGFQSFVGADLEDQSRLIREFIFSSRYRNEAGNRDFVIWRAGMDTGGGRDDEDITMTARAYTILRKVSDGKRLLGTKGERTTSAAKMRLRQIDKMPGMTGKAIPGGLNIWMLNADALKDAVHYYLGLGTGTAGALQFNADVKADLVSHILAEEKRKDRKGRMEWVQVSTKNHLLDCLTQAIAMGDRECLGGVEAIKRPQAYKVEQEEPPVEVTPEDDEPREAPVKNQGRGSTRNGRLGWFKR